MKFDFWVDGDKTFIRAHFESDDTRKGKRMEGPGTPIDIQTNLVYFDYAVRAIHPDLAALLCMVIFLPFIGSSVEFPWPVSPAVQRAFGIQELGNIRVRNVDENVKKYKGEDLCISYGGGVDSSSIRVMFPDSLIIHESHVKNGTIVKDNVTDVLRRLKGHQIMDIKTNQRYISLPGGWHTWTAAMATSILIATDFNIGGIMMGSNMGSTFLWNGTRFFDRIKRQKVYGLPGHHLQNTFYCVGLPTFSPVGGVTEIGSSNICYSNLNSEDVIYCIAKDGGPCDTCFKCLRRTMIKAALGFVDNVNWDAFDDEKNRTEINKVPLYFGHIYSYCAKRIDNLPDWISKPIAEVTPAEWAMHYYPDSLKLIPEKHRNEVKSVLEKYLTPMDEKMIEGVKAWPNKITAMENEQNKEMSECTDSEPEPKKWTKQIVQWMKK